MDNCKTLSQILIEADKVDNIEELSSYGDYLCNHAKEYPLIQLEYAHEHLANLAREMAIRHSKDLYKYIEELKR